MARYLVIEHYYASKARWVEAGTPKAAQEAFWRKHGNPFLCHKCSREVEMGEAYGTEVQDEDGKTLLSDLPDEKPATGEE